MERSITRRVDSKLIGYQVSLSDGFYNIYTKLWGESYSFDFVTEHRSFYTQLKINRKVIAKKMADLEALVDIAESKEEFQNFFEKKIQF